MTEQVQCAVCKMTVPKQSAGTVYHQGRAFYTCGPACRQQFVSNPAKYAQTATAATPTPKASPTKPQQPQKKK